MIAHLGPRIPPRCRVNRGSSSITGIDFGDGGLTTGTDVDCILNLLDLRNLTFWFAVTSLKICTISSVVICEIVYLMVNYPFSAVTLLVGRQGGHPVCRNPVLAVSIGSRFGCFFRADGVEGPSVTKLAGK